jgi:hypothetical protein
MNLLLLVQSLLLWRLAGFGSGTVCCPPFPSKQTRSESSNFMVKGWGSLLGSLSPQSRLSKVKACVPWASVWQGRPPLHAPMIQGPVGWCQPLRGDLVISWG